MLIGIIIYILSNILNIDEGQILLIISCFGFLSYYFSQKIIEPKNLDRINKTQRNYNWKLIIQCTLPTLVIIGTGLTIPFINLFFFHSFNVDSGDFALIGGITSLFVISSLLVPFVKKEYGFKKSIINTQIISVFEAFNWLYLLRLL